MQLIRHYHPAAVTLIPAADSRRPGSCRVAGMVGDGERRLPGRGECAGVVQPPVAMLRGAAPGRAPADPGGSCSWPGRSGDSTSALATAAAQLERRRTSWTYTGDGDAADDGTDKYGALTRRSLRPSALPAEGWSPEGCMRRCTVPGPGSVAFEAGGQFAELAAGPAVQPTLAAPSANKMSVASRPTEGGATPIVDASAARGLIPLADDRRLAGAVLIVRIAEVTGKVRREGAGGEAAAGAARTRAPPELLHESTSPGRSASDPATAE